jgi:hypothetical protein
MYRIARTAASLLALSMPFAAYADATAGMGSVAPKRATVGGEPVKSALWVGNSFFYYNNGIHRFIGGLSNAAKDPVRGTMVTISGSGANWHDIETYIKPGASMGSYSFQPDNSIKMNAPGRQYDTVVMMDCSQCPIHPQLKPIGEEAFKKNAEVARKYGARPVYFMSWAYKDAPPMTAQLADAYTTMGNANDALVIPAGLAFAKSIAARPNLELYAPDKRHPSLAGTYLAAATSYAALTGKSPVGNTYKAELDAETVAFLQQVAWDTVQEYYARAKAPAR